jgi:hypothetical protein
MPPQQLTPKLRNNTETTLRNNTPKLRNNKHRRAADRQALSSPVIPTVPTTLRHSSPRQPYPGPRRLSTSPPCQAMSYSGPPSTIRHAYAAPATRPAPPHPVRLPAPWSRHLQPASCPGRQSMPRRSCAAPSRRSPRRSITDTAGPRRHVFSPALVRQASSSQHSPRPRLSSPARSDPPSPVASVLDRPVKPKPGSHQPVSKPTSPSLDHVRPHLTPGPTSQVLIRPVTPKPKPTTHPQPRPLQLPSVPTSLNLSRLVAPRFQTDNPCHDKPDRFPIRLPTSRRASPTHAMTDPTLPAAPSRV